MRINGLTVHQNFGQISYDKKRINSILGPEKMKQFEADVIEINPEFIKLEPALKVNISAKKGAKTLEYKLFDSSDDVLKTNLSIGKNNKNPIYPIFKILIAHIKKQNNNIFKLKDEIKQLKRRIEILEDRKSGKVDAAA